MNDLPMGELRNKRTVNLGFAESDLLKCIYLAPSRLSGCPDMFVLKLISNVHQNMPNVFCFATVV